MIHVVADMQKTFVRLEAPSSLKHVDSSKGIIDHNF